MRLLSNIKGECQRGVSSCSAKLSDCPNPDPESQFAARAEEGVWREGESWVCERATERETRADQASVSKHIIMYFFKTQKATPQQRTKQKERDRGRERGSERERGEAKRSWAAGKQKQSVKFMLHEQLSSRSARGSARLPRRSIIRCVRAILFTNKSQGKRASLAITRSASLPPSFPLSCCANTVESLSLAVRSAALTFAHWHTFVYAPLPLSTLCHSSFSLSYLLSPSLSAYLADSFYCWQTECLFASCICFCT